jgi:chemotaxis protein CheZ
VPGCDVSGSTVSGGADSGGTISSGTLSGNTVPSVITRTWSKHEVYRTLDELRDVWRDYAELLCASLEPGPLPEEKRTLMEFHRGRFKNATPPPRQMSEIAALLGDLLELVTHRSVAFRVPARSALLPEEHNLQLARLSRRLSETSAPLESLADSLVPVATLKRMAPPVAAPPSGDGNAAQGGAAGPGADDGRAASLRAAMASLFKGIVRRDWADVTLVMNHINLITTTGKSPGVVREVGHIARDIYNQLQEFSRELDYRELTESSQNLPDAIGNLNSVIQRLEDFANASLDALEQLTADALDDEQAIDAGLAALDACDRELAELAAAHPGAAEPAGRIRTELAGHVRKPLAAIKQHRGQVRDAYLALISNMSFQDLTGQTLKKVIGFIEDLQSKLVKLIARQGSTHLRPGEPAASVPMEGPDPNRGLAPLTQTDVDKTLANLGF